MQEHSGANKKWTDRLREFQLSNFYRESFGIDGEPIEFEWNIFQHIQNNLQDQKIDPEH